MANIKEKFRPDVLSFKNDNELSQIIFDNLRSNKERKVIHELCEEYGLFSASSGPDNKRIVTISKTKIIKEVEITDEDRKLFIKDSGLPIPVWRQPYFSYFLTLYMQFYNADELYELFKEAIEILFSRNKNFISFTHMLVNIVCENIKNNPHYEKLLTDESHIPSVVPNNCDIYVKRDNIWPKYYITLDIIKANFSALKFFNKELVSGCDSWEEFIAKFTDIKYYAKAKYFRQACLGNLKVKRMGSIQLYLLSYLYGLIKDLVKVAGKVSNDEIIIETTKETLMSDYQILKSIVDSLPENMKGIWRIEPFVIEPLGRSTAFVKKYFDGDNIDLITKEEIKQIEKDFHAQAYKYYTNQELVLNDFKAMKDNYLITYEDKYSFD
ncbi:R3H domain-containing protein [Fadolivirus algeromassiliense]|jgi:hypothetical protein|uniref:R3H domain-containing protein n=1 Tax=Fadolivirus FV1/VV64 TaxID=3070911 RepID=A0A7D3QWD9_9VIRU|nr:R3H domain-containing protein [Fadolivirus algeromassiliense]QKF94426.1 R3H domain-containing protein [Fadolivirus FV1/VV64]